METRAANSHSHNSEKLWIKALNSYTGANHFLTLRSYLATARKHTIQPLDALRAAAHGNTWLPATP